MLAAIKPTLGRVSRHGIIPLTADQDTAGPMARSVTDAAILLGVLEGPAPDPNDPATTACAPPPNRDYTAFLKRDALKGARIGIPRAFFYEKAEIPGSQEPRGGLNPERARVMVEAIAILQQQGAVIVDPANIPSVLETDRGRNVLAWDICEKAKGQDADCSVVLKYGFKRDFNKWLESLGPAAPVKTLTELRVWNLTHQRSGAIKYGQGLLDISDEMHLEQDRARYEADRARDLRLAGEQGIDAAFAEHRLDALLFPGGSGSELAAVPGYPTVIVPFGMVPNAPTTRVPARLRRETVTLRGELHRPRVQRAAADRARLRLRAGDEAAGAAAGRAVGEQARWAASPPGSHDRRECQPASPGAARAPMPTEPAPVDRPPLAGGQRRCADRVRALRDDDLRAVDAGVGRALRRGAGNGAAHVQRLRARTRRAAACSTGRCRTGMAGAASC